MESKNNQSVASEVAAVISIPGYKMLDVLGRGGMAIVYLAEQESIGRRVALKVLSPDHSDPTFSDRFLREARIISKLAHPNIITIFDAGIHQGCHYMSMEYITGKNLREARDDLSRKQKIGIIKQIAQALDFAGGKGYVHRDIKPENIMLHEDGRAILTDFGIARGQETQHGLTQTGKTIGTPYYMSPEQTKGVQVDHRSDIYSLGVVLFQAIAGYVPYDGSSMVDIGIKHISDPIPPLPKGLELFQPIINICMSKDPDHRYQTAGEFLVALNKISDSELDYIEAKANVTAPTRSPQSGTLIGDALTPPPTRVKSKPVSRPKIYANQRPIDITETDDYKNLSRRRKRILLLILLLTLAGLGYYQRDQLMPIWQEKILPGVAAYIPENIKQKLGMATIAKQEKTTPDKTTASNPAGGTVQPATTAHVDSNVLTDDASNVAVVQPKDPTETLLAELDQSPQNAIELAIIYKQKLLQNPLDTEVKTAITNLQNWYRKEIYAALEAKDLEHVQQRMKMLRESFPNAAQTAEYQRMVEQTELLEKFKKHLKMADVYFATNALTKPEGANALGELQAAAKLDNNSPEVQQGLSKIADLNFKKASETKKPAEAMEYVLAGLQAVKDHPELLMLKYELNNKFQNNLEIKEDVTLLLRKIKDRQYLAPKGSSVFDLSHMILKKDPGNEEALRGLRIVEEQFMLDARAALKKDELTKAKTILDQANQYFKDSPLLSRVRRQVEQKIDATFPRITNIVFSDKPITSLTEKPALEKMRPGQELYVGFAFKNFYTSNTTLDIRLSDSTGQELFSEIPVTVDGKSGRHFLSITLPLSGTPNGDYTLEILMENTRIERAKLVGLH